MAHLLSSTPLPQTEPTVVRVFHLLKRLPDDYFIAQRLRTTQASGPDFLIQHRDKQVLLITVVPTTEQEALQPDLFSTPTPEPVGQSDAVALRQFLTSVEPASGALLFPLLTDTAVRQLRPADSLPWGSKAVMDPQTLAGWVTTHLSPSLSPEAITTLRSAFSPEVVVPAALTVRQPPDRNLGAGLSDYLLDYNQEQILKTDLALTTEGTQTAREFGVRLVNGIAGSGKSLVILYRARLLRQLFPQQKILVLTHNRALKHDLRQRYLRLAEGDTGVAFYTFMGWCRRYWPDNQPWRDPIRFAQRRQIVAESWYQYLSGTAVSEQMLTEEIDWYKDRLLFSKDDYLQADRTGRGFALIETMRQRVYEAMLAYHARLQELKLMDWGDVPRQIWRFLESGDLHPPQYDAILVDEAQFFAPLWFEIIKRLLKPRSGHLFLVADPTQGFLKRRQSWLASGLEVRGRSHRLDRSYRTTREILEFATLLYQQRLPTDDEEIVAPDTRRMLRGILPVIIPLTSQQDEATRVINEIHQLHQAGIPWGHILILHASWEETGPLIRRLQVEFGPETAVDPGQIVVGNQIRVCSLNGATGLESPIVFLMGLHGLYEQEQSVRLSEEEHQELIRDNTRRLYMAITRAGQRLVITYVGTVPEALTRLATLPVTDTDDIREMG